MAHTCETYIRRVVSSHLIGLFLILSLCGPLAAEPTIHFVSQLHSVVEDSTNLPVALVISEDPAMTIYASIDITGGSASEGWDFVGGSTLAYFHPGGGDTAYAYVQIYEDSETEPPETIALTLDDSPAYVVGNPGTAQVTIIDDESTSLAARFEIDADVPLDPFGRIVLFRAPGQSLSVDVVVDELPPGGGNVLMATNQDSGIETLVFTDEPRMTLQYPPPVHTPGTYHSTLELELLDPPPDKTTESPQLSSHTVYIQEMTVHDCSVCLIYYAFVLFGMFTCDFLETNCPEMDCPGSPPETKAPPSEPFRTIDPTADFEILRRYRDEVLAASPVGDYYVQLYETNSRAVAEAVVSEPTLIYRVMDTWGLWLPAVAAQVDGQGAGFVITGEMQTALLGVMTEFEAAGSPELAELMADFRVELDLENVAGTTAADLQQAVEDNPMPGERANWGDVKAIYGER